MKQEEYLNNIVERLEKLPIENQVSINRILIIAVMTLSENGQDFIKLLTKLVEESK